MPSHQFENAQREQSDDNRRERRSLPERFWPPVAAGLLMVVVGTVAYFTNQPFLYPSLGPTAFLQAEYPFHRSSRFRDTTIGHLIGVIAGLFSVLILGVRGSPPIGSGAHSSTLRIGAAALTVALVILIEIVTKVSNPPSAGTGLLFALGYFQPHLGDVGEVLTGVLFLATFGAIIRHFRAIPPAAPVAPDAPRSNETEN